MFLVVLVVLYLIVGISLLVLSWEYDEFMREFSTHRERAVCAVWFIVGWPHLIWRYGE